MHIRRLNNPAIRPLEPVPKRIRRPDEHTIRPPEPLDNGVLASAARHVRRVVSILLKHRPDRRGIQPLKLGHLTSGPAGGVPGAERRVEVALCESQGQVLHGDVRRVFLAEGGGRVEEALHQDVLQGRPDVGLVPLLGREEVRGWDAARFFSQEGLDADKSVLDRERIVPQLLGRGARPEGVELADVEDDLVVLVVGTSALGGRGVLVDRDMYRLGAAGQIVVKVGPVRVVPHERVHGLAAALGALEKLLGQRLVGGRVLKEVADDALVLVQDRVEVDGDQVDDVEGAQREVDVAGGVVGAREPSGRVVPSRLGAASEVGVQLGLLRLVQGLDLGVDYTVVRVVGVVVSGDVILTVGLRSRLVIVDTVPRGEIGLVLNRTKSSGGKRMKLTY